MSCHSNIKYLWNLNLLLLIPKLPLLDFGERGGGVDFRDSISNSGNSLIGSDSSSCAPFGGGMLEDDWFRPPVEFLFEKIVAA